MAVNDTIATLLTELKQIVKSETVFGEPITAGETTIIPVSKISFGFAAAGSGKDHGNSGTGGGVQVIPVALITVQKDKVQVHQVEKGNSDLSSLLGMAPELVERIWKKVGKKSDKSDSKDDK